MSKIMIIDDDLTCLNLAKAALEMTNDIQLVQSGEKALYMLNRLPTIPDLILLDVEMPEMSGFQVIKKIKENPVTNSVPVIFLTALTDATLEYNGLLLGAIDYIFKPFSPALLQKRVQLHLTLIEQTKTLENYNKSLETIVSEKTESVYNLQRSIIYSISDLIQKKDGYTGSHTKRVSLYIEILLNALVEKGAADFIVPEDVEIIALSSQLHDVGKIAIPDQILLKQGKLEADEFEYMKRHASTGSDAIIKSIVFQSASTEERMRYLSMDEVELIKLVRLTTENVFLKYALDMARYHHEKWNGKGYPDGLSGEKIPFVARVLAVMDVYDALRSKRPYKEPFAHEMAVEIIKEESGVSFDPSIVAVFLEVQAKIDAAYRAMSGLYDDTDNTHVTRLAKTYT